jgi:hypothetical protein
MWWRVAACLAALTPAAAGALVELGADRDNTLYEDPNGGLSNGAGENFFAGRTSVGLLHRGLVRFDVASALPAGSTITAVTLTLHMSRTLAGPEPVDLQRALADWGEGASYALGNGGAGAPAEPGDATWLHTFYDTQYWATPGGDFAAGASASTLVGDVGFYAWSSPALIADVQMWLDQPGANFGWLLRGNEDISMTSKRFDTHENLEPTFRPVLAITYVPEPATAGLLATGGIAMLRRRRA